MKKKKMKFLSLFLTITILMSSFSASLFSVSAADILYGDADKNGSVDVSDATTVQKYIVSLIGEEDIDLTAAEVTGDDDVNVKDATCIQKYAAEQIDKFPVEETPSTVTLVFNVTIPEALDEGANVSIGSNLNGWDPSNTDWFMTKIDDFNYTLTAEAPAEYIGEEVQYKYTVQLPDQENIWAQVEGGPTGGEIGNRTFIISADGNTVNDTVSMFKNQTGMSTVTGGTLETFKLDMPQYDDGRTRNIRVWLPEGYDPEDTEKKYPVFYMHDGQNLFDSYTSFAGEWQVDEAVTDMMAQGYEGAIIVGIDNSGDRINEYTPTWDGVDSSTADNPSGDKYAAFIVETLKPYIDSHYNVRTDKDSTGIGGSSMGGLISYYIGIEYPDVFGQVLVFSPSFWLFPDEVLDSVITSSNLAESENQPKFFLYAGGSGGESSITRYVDYMKNGMVAAGYPEDKIETLVDESQTHSESAWAKYFPQAYQWLVGFEAAPPVEKDFYRIYIDTTYSGWETPYIAMWIGGTNIVPMTPVEGKANLFYYDLPKEQTEFLFRANDDLTQWGEAASVNVTFRPANENMVYTFDSQVADGKYSGSWHALPEEPEKENYRVYFDVSMANWDTAYICMWIGEQNFVEMTPVDGKPGVYAFDLPKDQTAFLLRADLDFSNWGEYSSADIAFSPENENMVYVFTGQRADGKYEGSWQAYEQ